jgi:hypothetical protein
MSGDYWSSDDDNLVDEPVVEQALEGEVEVEAKVNVVSLPRTHNRGHRIARLLCGLGAKILTSGCLQRQVREAPQIPWKR